MTETIKDTAPQAKKGGAPRGNRNNISPWPFRRQAAPGLCSCGKPVQRALECELEDTVIAARGEVTLVDAANIQTAIRWERHGALALRWLRTQGDQLKPTDQLAFSREIARASTERDKALAALKLDRDAADDVLKSLYAKPVPLLVNNGATNNGAGGTNK